MSIDFFGKTLSGPFTVPSGIVTCAAPIIQKFFDEIPEVGVLTTKSICLEPRLGYREPILHQYAPGCFVNAVGLTNPGAKKSAELMSQLIDKAIKVGKTRDAERYASALHTQLMAAKIAQDHPAAQTGESPHSAPGGTRRSPSRSARRSQALRDRQRT